LRGVIATPFDATSEPDIERFVRKWLDTGAAFSIDASLQRLNRAQRSGPKTPPVSTP
jgi:hypothetical protein